MADTRYLTKQRQGWYLRMRVPGDLRDRMGKSEIVETLNTRDIAVAQVRRWDRVAEAMHHFATLRGRPEADREAEREQFRRTLQRLQAEEWGEDDLDALADKLEDTEHDRGTGEGSPEWDAKFHFLRQQYGRPIELPARYRLTFSEAAKRSIPVLETERLLLRPFRAADFEPLARLNRDPAFMRFFGARAMSEGESWRQLAMFIGHWQLKSFGFWAVEEKASGRFIGRIGCHEPAGWPGFEVGWGLDPAFWGRGLATEGGRAALAYAWHVLGVFEVISVIDPGNVASIRVAEKLGARYERRMDLDGQPVLIYRHRDPRR